MPSFITNLFPSPQTGKFENITPLPPHIAFSDRPNTPNLNDFITPVTTPQGSPSKTKNPPGANDLPIAFEIAMKLEPTKIGSPTKLGPSQLQSPLSPTKGNTLSVDDSHLNVSDIHKSHKHKTLSSPIVKYGKENTPATARQNVETNNVAIARHELYQKETQVSKYNTQRVVTAKEYEILQKAHVKRLSNVTQLCKLRNLKNSIS